MNLLVVGDMKGRADDSSIEERSMVSINKNNFSSVMGEMDIKLNINVPNKLSGKDNDELNVDLSFGSLNDFSPDSIANKVPELKKTFRT